MTHDYTVLELDKVLDRLAAHTAGPDAAAAARALRPAVQCGEVRRRLDETDDACRLMAGFGAPSFGRLLPPQTVLSRAAAGACLTPGELLQIAETLRIVRGVSGWRQYASETETVLDDRFFSLSPNKYLEEKITAAIPSEEEIADNASPALHDIRRKMRAASSRVREQLDHMIHAATVQKFLQEPLITQRDGRFVIPVKAANRADVPGLVHDTSASGATVFIEPMAVVETNNELRLLQAREQAEIERILAALSEEVGGFADGILRDYELLVELNVIFAKARLAYDMKGTKPTVREDGRLILRGARHPLIDPDRVVPIDVELGGAFDTLVITGPNTGGKTVTLKTVGLITLMTLCGLLPPVKDGSEVPVFAKLLVDIGDEQSIEQSLSTFSAHMTNLIRILLEADDHSLVLLDEIGAGTDPVEGAALAVAILEQLRTQGCRLVATTHYAELKAYAIETDGVENGSCAFDVATLRPTYRLILGAPGRSNAFAITEKLGMDPALVARAKRLISGENRRLEAVVRRLEERRAALEEQQKAAVQAAASAKEEQEKTRARLQALENERIQTLESARAEGQRLLESARAEAEALLRELQEMRRQKSSGHGTDDPQSRLRARLRRLDDRLDPVIRRQEEDAPPERPLKPGDTVRLTDLGQEAVVTALPDDKQAEVQIGAMRTRVPLSRLRLTGKKAAKSKTTTHGVSGRMERSAKTDLDLRGMTTEEALLEVDRFLDQALLSGLERVTLIHGKGTGALRAAVQQHLKGHPAVRAFRLGVYGEGETGVTVAELR